MTGISNDTQSGQITETWSMSSSVMLQTGSVDIEIFYRSTELRGDVLESRKRVEALRLEYLRTARREIVERLDNSEEETEEILRLAIRYFGSNAKNELDPKSSLIFRRAVSDFEKQSSSQRYLMNVAERATQGALARLIEELAHHIELFTPLDVDQTPIAYILLDMSLWNVATGQPQPALRPLIRNTNGSLISDPLEVIGQFVYPATESFDLPLDVASSLADNLYTALGKMPLPVYGSAPESLKSLVASLGGTGFVGAIGYSSELDSITLTCFSAGAAFLFWFGRPHITTVRDASNEWLKRKLNEKLGLADDEGSADSSDS